LIQRPAKTIHIDAHQNLPRFLYNFADSTGFVGLRLYFCLFWDDFRCPGYSRLRRTLPDWAENNHLPCFLAVALGR